MTILDRLLGRSAPAPDAKAATGSGAYNLAWHTPLSAMSRDPHRLMAEAQSLFHSNWTVHAAETAIGNRLKTTAWHLEDEDGETVDENSPEQLQAIWRLLMRPNPTQTRTQLWSLTGRHTGLAGNAFWYLDQRDALAGTPLSLMYINPCRMTPTQDAAGNVTGWTLDHPDNQVVNAYQPTQRTGVPLEVEEVLHFRLDEPDTGVWGIGVAESAQRLISISRLTDTHASGVLSSGGRLSGLITPKAQTAVGPDEWVQFVRDWRSITSDPDAAKRLQIAKMPLDFTQMTASPKDLQLLDVSKSTRDDILAAWQVPPSQLGISQSRGLNSGETQNYEEAAMSQGAVEPRGEAMRETIQVGLLDRWAELGIKVRLVIEWPQFDDEAPLYANAEKAKVIPLTIDQRLEQVGKDPLDPKVYGELGTAIYIDRSMVPLFDPLGGGGGSALPPPGGLAPTPTVEPSTEASGEEEDVVTGKSRLSESLGTVRSRVTAKWEPRFQRVVDRVLGGQLDLALSHAEHIARKPNDAQAWWNEEREQRRWLEAINAELEQFGREVADKSRSITLVTKAIEYETILGGLKQDIGARITNINETTRDAVRQTISSQITGVSGLDPSPKELAGIIRGAVMQNGQPVFGELRSETISRTETAHLYNQATLHTYQQMGVEEVEAIDGTHDAECAARNGARFLAVEARGIADHPNGTLDWIPVVDSRTAAATEARIASDSPEGRALARQQYRPRTTDLDGKPLRGVDLEEAKKAQKFWDEMDNVAVELDKMGLPSQWTGRFYSIKGRGYYGKDNGIRFDVDYGSGSRGFVRDPITGEVTDLPGDLGPRYHGMTHELLHGVADGRGYRTEIPGGWEEGPVDIFANLFGRQLRSGLSLSSEAEASALRFGTTNTYGPYREGMELIRALTGKGEREFYRTMMETPLRQRPAKVAEMITDVATSPADRARLLDRMQDISNNYLVEVI